MLFTVSHDCQGYNDCENGGKCFENNATCPTKSVCMCEKCYYGDKCHLTSVSYIHDPIYRELFYDNDEERTWCIVNYSSNLKVFDTFITLFHFLLIFYLL
jgi:hypothetical protein